MSAFFGRRARVKVGLPNEPGKSFETLRVVFKADKTLEIYPNRINLQIYNLAPESRAVFENKKAIVTLDVGYTDSISQIFIGNVIETNHKRQGPDIITEVVAEDGGLAFRESTAEVSFPPGTKTTDVISALAPLLQGVVNTPPSLSGLVTSAREFVRGYASSGSVAHALTSVLELEGLNWSIQDNSFQVSKGNAAVKSVSALVVRADTGLVGSPTRNQELVRFTMLMEPRLRPGGAIKLDSEFLKGTFRVESVAHQGDSFAGAWTSEVECVSTTPL